MTIIVWLVIGGIAGWLASKVMGKDKQMGVVANVVTGVVGAFLGGWVVKLMGGEADVLTGFNLPSLATAFVGAVILLAILRAIKK